MAGVTDPASAPTTAHRAKPETRSAHHPSGGALTEVPVGALIRAYRRTRQMTIAGLAAAAGYQTRYLEMIEAGTRVPSLSALGEIAAALGVPASALLTPAPAADLHVEVERAFRTAPGLDGAGQVAELEELYARTATWWAEAMERHHHAAEALPHLIRLATLASHPQAGAASREAAAHAWRLVEAILTPTGRADLARLAAERAAAQEPRRR